MHFKYIVIMIAVFKIHSCSWSCFWNGRLTNGNVGEPCYCETDEPNLLDLARDHYFEQHLDHFDPTNHRTWRQRYFVNSTSYVRGGPIFLMLSGESVASPRWMARGAWTHYGRTHNALLFLLEHRFYGKSQPTPDISTNHLKYLTSMQAIEDSATFVTKMNDKYKITATSKWFVFGGSYSASLATWLRLKYPNLVYAAVASSGPLYAEVDFQDYFRVVERSLATYNGGDGSCLDAVAELVDEVRNELLTMDGQQRLNDKLILCDPVQTAISIKKDLSNLFQNIAGQFAYVVQYNSTRAVLDINQLCSIMVNTTLGSPLDRFSTANLKIMDSQLSACVDFKYDKMLEKYKKTSWCRDTSLGVRQWTFQTCNEFGFYQTPYDRSCVFGQDFPIAFYVQQCSDIFGPAFDETSLYDAARRTNERYGGFDINTTNVFTTQGSTDPWHTLGLVYSPNDQMPTVFLNGCAHCSDIYEPLVTDFPQLKEVRTQISRWIGSLLND